MKPFSKLSMEEVKNILNRFQNIHTLLERENREGVTFIKMKREHVQPVVLNIYDDIFNNRNIEPVFVEFEEIKVLKKFSENFIEYKISLGEPGWSKDRINGVARIFNGTCGHLAVLKSMGGSLSNIDLSFGSSKEYNIPDLKEWLDGKFYVGVKTASIADPKSKSKNKISNLPLVLDYKNINHKYIEDWEKDDLKYGKNHVVESQIMVGTKEVYKKTKDMSKKELNRIKCFVIGVASPKIIINGASTAFTLDRNAAKLDKKGGPKAGFFNLHLTNHFKNRTELINILKMPKYSPIPYNKIKENIDPFFLWDFNTKQTGY